jgi:hypothetical protein
VFDGHAIQLSIPIKPVAFEYVLIGQLEQVGSPEIFTPNVPAEHNGHILLTNVSLIIIVVNRAMPAIII